MIWLESFQFFFSSWNSFSKKKKSVFNTTTLVRPPASLAHTCNPLLTIITTAILQSVLKHIYKSFMLLCKLPPSLTAEADCTITRPRCQVPAPSLLLPRGSRYSARSGLPVVPGRARHAVIFALLSLPRIFLPCEAAHQSTH